MTIISGMVTRAAGVLVRKLEKLELSTKMTQQWSFCVRNETLYVSGKEDPVIDLQASRREPNSIKVKFLNADKPKLLPISRFSPGGSSLSKIFKDCEDGSSFNVVWKESIAPFLDIDSGHFSGMCASETTSSGVDDRSTVTPKRKSSLSPCMMPATKMARKQATISGSEDETTMDNSIHKHFLGFFKLSVMLLSEPTTSSVVREKDDNFVSRLKKEMLDNPLNDVQPIVCLVNLPDGGAFQSYLKEAYTYQTIGGNHSREALMQILKEHPHLKQNDLYSHRLCSVYRPMSLNLVRRLASKHNRATSFSHSTTTWDRVLQCRKLLFELSHLTYSEEDDAPSKKPPKWKSVCAAVLAQTVEQLDDAMIFHLATLSGTTFCIVRIVFEAYSRGALKGQKGGKKTQTKPPELKGSTLKCLRGIDPTTADGLLTEVSEGEISLAELQSQCVSIKQLSKIQAAFTKATNSISWEEACKKFPDFASAEKLEPFKKLNFNKPVFPNEFMKYCQLAITKQRSCDGDVALKTHTDDNVFVFNFNSAIGIFWKHDMPTVDSPSLNEILEKASQLSSSSVKCQGFSLSVFNLYREPASSSDDTHTDQEPADTQAVQLALIVRAVNYSFGVQQYSVVFITRLEDIASIASRFSDENCQTGVCVVTDKANKEPSGHGISQDTYGLVFLLCGGAVSKGSMSNALLCEKNEVYLDEARNQLNKSSKTAALSSKLINGFTCVGDWVIDGTGGIGTLMIEALKLSRNCLSVENEPILFINSKINCVDKLSCTVSTD